MTERMSEREWRKGKVFKLIFAICCLVQFGWNIYVLIQNCVVSDVLLTTADHRMGTMLCQFCMWIWKFLEVHTNKIHCFERPHLSDMCHRNLHQRCEYFLFSLSFIHPTECFGLCWQWWDTSRWWRRQLCGREWKIKARKRQLWWWNAEIWKFGSFYWLVGVNVELGFVVICRLQLLCIFYELSVFSLPVFSIIQWANCAHHNENLPTPWINTD